jgi:hypothetical protein
MPQIKFGVLGSLHVSLSWSQLFSKPIKIEIQEVTILAATRWGRKPVAGQ